MPTLLNYSLRSIIMDRVKFIKGYKKEIEPLYINVISDNFVEKFIRQKIIDGNIVAEFAGGFCDDFSKCVNFITGSLTAKTGYFYEKRLYIVDKILRKMKVETKAKIYNNEILKMAGLDDNVSFDDFLKVSRILMTLPKVVKEEIHTMSKELYSADEVRFSYTEGLKHLFDMMVENYGVDEVKFFHDLDHCIKTKYDKIFLVECKTKERLQDYNVWGDVNKLLETWAALTYGMIKRYRTSALKGVEMPKWNTISILYLMNEKTDDTTEKDIKYFPRFRSNNISKGGCITAKEFYRYFYGVNIEDILAVEKLFAGYVAIFEKKSIDFLWDVYGAKKKILKKNFENYIKSI